MTKTMHNTTGNTQKCAIHHTVKLQLDLHKYTSYSKTYRNRVFKPTKRNSICTFTSINPVIININWL